MIVIVHLCVILLILWTVYLVVARSYTIATAIEFIFKNLHELYLMVKRILTALWERSQHYCIYQDFSPYIKSLKELRIAKYINYRGYDFVSPDVTAFSFEIIKINDEYKENITALSQLLTVTLRDFYIDRLGNYAPAIYLSHIQEGEFVFWVARNLHGNNTVNERIESDRQQEKPDKRELPPEFPENKLPALGWDMETYENLGINKAISLDVRKKPSGLVVGASGTGKSYFVTAFLHQIAKIYGDSLILYYCDFKASEDTEYLLQYSRYYSGDDCAEGLSAYYEEYQAVKHGKRDEKLRLLFFDEWAGFQIWETQKSKKQAEIYRGMLQEILLMGRSMLCGVWIILQRPDSSWLQGRENFQSICCFLSGGISNELARMISLEEEIADKIKQREFFQVGEAVVKIDGEKAKFMKVPQIDANTYKTEILDMLSRADGEAGSTA